MDTRAIIHEVLKGYALHPRSFHGIVHWARVLENGLRLAPATGARRSLLEKCFEVKTEPFSPGPRRRSGSDPGGIAGAKATKGSGEKGRFWTE